MTTIQAIHHVEQMQAARAEFSEFWEKESKELKKKGFGGIARINIQISCWNAFLKGKGLK